MKSLAFATISELKTALNDKSLSVSELLSATLNRFSLYDPKVKSALEIFDHDSILKKTCIEAEGTLSGIPGLLKDNICQKDRITSCASKILQNYCAPYDATVVARLHQAGALSVGRANCDEFAMGSSTESSAFQLTYNPWDITRVPGGSSGGSIAAVAAGFVPFALGTETGGSVRQPAAFCNTVGLKPTYGLISRYGVVAYASSLDQVGIATRTVYDSATVLSVLAGKDERDSTTRVSWRSYDYTAKLASASCKGKRIAYIENALDAQGVEPEVKELLHQALKKMQELGAIVEPIRLNTMDYSAALYIIISRAEAASNLARFDGVKYGYRAQDVQTLEEMYIKTRTQAFGPNVRRRILIGNYVLSAGYADQFYNKARAVQKLMKQECLDAFKKYDALFLPVVPSPAFHIGEISSNSLAIDLQDYFTAVANLAGIPALAVPCGFVRGLPMGFQIMGNEFCEETLLEIGHAYQQVTDWHLKRPPLFC